MKKTKILLLSLVLVSVLGIGNLSARESTVAVGIQAGFVATGVVLDLQLGSLGFSAGLNYPIGYTYIASLAEASDEDLFANAATVTADITTAFDLSDSFSLKVGICTIALTNFGPTFGGVAGPCLKGEYWIPNKRTGLFVNLNAPVMLYGVAVSEFGESDSAVVFSPWLPLAGLFTTTFGVLYGF
ncbi:hypothetical protein SpiGrapes_0964 [Sphaerochaeta pleomorpha str. Grapes]|uniref:Uncharacterized protein n=1 Tax=Sphaerochaeta pleomorpha (strain ATCC BAA-1885 / DSM 22778 / Grapes) TaxID=158190 RepID=G8QRD6_SPHPG|nr:hypothetical protein [Sphaerochaeta pleomorpha]AEV28789.1 hypothetical protein SpiGrapes_0964 [Sphaerochaeta pleomorpha str. Grapes]